MQSLGHRDPFPAVSSSSGARKAKEGLGSLPETTLNGPASRPYETADTTTAHQRPQGMPQKGGPLSRRGLVVANCGEERWQCLGREMKG